MSIRPYLLLMRPANIVTAIADILAGISITNFLIDGWTNSIAYLIVATIGLYGGGVVFNDVFDKDLDAIERPERPLPSGQVSLRQASILGGSLLALGILFAFLVSKISGVIAIIIAVLALTYNKYAKHHTLIGPINMGLCRSFNLLLGISISLVTLQDLWYIAIIPLIFIGDITLTSQGEVKGGNQNNLYIALFLDFLVIGLFVLLHFYTSYEILQALPFLVLWLGMNSTFKLKAIKNNQPKMVMQAVKMGVLSLIPLNAGIAAGFQGWLIGLVVLALLPLSFGLAKYFSVT